MHVSYFTYILYVCQGCQEIAVTKKITRSKGEQSAATTQRLIEIARSHFAEHGYAQASTEAIVNQAGVTRGALYHHFGSKEGLFKAVLTSVQAEVGQRVAAAVEATHDAWEQLLVGCQAFLRASLEPDVRRILLIDGPATVGWGAWREMDAENSMRLLQAGLQELADQELIAVVSVAAATHLLSGAMNESALWIASSSRPQQALDDSLAVLETLLNGLRVR